MAKDVSVTIYGCRGSYPVSGPDFSNYGGATSCVVVRAGDREVILDAGSGIISHGNELLSNHLSQKKHVNATILFSHVHFDHLIGLPYFPPFFHPASTIHLFGPRTSRFESFEQTIEALIQSPYYPVALHEMAAKKCFYDTGEADEIYFVSGEPTPLQVRAHHPSEAHRVPDKSVVDVKISCMRGYNHPKSGINIYKVEAAGKSVVYATDTEGYVHGDQRLADFARGADLLIHDAMYTDDHYTKMPVPTQGYGHSTVQIATNLASLAEVDKLCLFHHDPKSTDQVLDNVATMSREQFPNTVVARDGLTIEL